MSSSSDFASRHVFSKVDSVTFCPLSLCFTSYSFFSLFFRGRKEGHSPKPVSPPLKPVSPPLANPNETLPFIFTIYSIPLIYPSEYLILQIELCKKDIYHNMLFVVPLANRNKTLPFIFTIYLILQI